MKIKSALLAVILLSAIPSLLLGAPFSPWDAWRQGYTMFEKGQQQRDRGSYRRALQYFESALESYESVRKARPDWNQKIIQGRIDDCRKAIAAVKLQLNDASGDIFPQTSTGEKAKPTVPPASDLPAGIERQAYPQIFISSDDSTAPRGGATLSGAEIEAQRAELNKLRTENERYKNRLLQTMVELDDLRRQLAQNKSSAEEVSNLLEEGFAFRFFFVICCAIVVIRCFYSCIFFNYGFFCTTNALAVCITAICCCFFKMQTTETTGC